MRNILLSRGCANGVAFIVLSVDRHHVECMNISPGEYFGNIEYFFRVKITITVKKSGFTFTRIQFPLRTSFASTTHKFQGDSLSCNGFLMADARFPPFCHGQTYVLFSRAQRADQIIAVTSEEYPNAVVGMAFKELINWDSDATCTFHTSFYHDEQEFDPDRMDSMARNQPLHDDPLDESEWFSSHPDVADEPHQEKRPRE